MDSKEKGELRSKSPKLWQSLLISCALLGTLAAATSFGKKQDTSPEQLIKIARELAEEGKFDEALEKYLLIKNQKPQIPAVFIDAEKEISQVRIKALEAKKKAEEEAKKAEQPDEQKPGDTGTEGTEEQPPKPDEVPNVDLPELPDIGGM